MLAKFPPELNRSWEATTGATTADHCRQSQQTPQRGVAAHFAKQAERSIQPEAWPLIAISAVWEFLRTFEMPPRGAFSIAVSTLRRAPPAG